MPYEQIKAERKRQTEKFGVQSRALPVWISLISEELGEAAKEANEIHHAKEYPDLMNPDIEKFKKELIQVAALCVQVLESLE